MEEKAFISLGSGPFVIAGHRNMVHMTRILSSKCATICLSKGYYSLYAQLTIVASIALL